MDYQTEQYCRKLEQDKANLYSDIASLKKENAELKDKVSRRNMQIKDLQAELQDVRNGLK